MHESYSNLLWMRLWVRLTSDWPQLFSLKKENLYVILFAAAFAGFGSRWASKVLSIKSSLHKLVSSSKYVTFSLIKLVVYRGLVAELTNKIKMMSMKVKHLCKEIAPGSIQAGPHPRRWLLDRDESKGYLQAGKKKEEKKTQVYLIYCSCCCPLWKYCTSVRIRSSKAHLGICFLFLCSFFCCYHLLAFYC